MGIFLLCSNHLNLFIFRAAFPVVYAKYNVSENIISVLTYNNDFFTSSGNACLLIVGGLPTCL